MAQPVWNMVSTLLQKPESVLNRIEKQLKKDSVYHALLDEKEILDKRLAELKNARVRVKEAFRRNSYTYDELEEELGIIEKGASEVREQIEALNSQLTLSEDKEEKILSIKELAKKYKHKFHGVSYDQKWEILQRLVKRIVYDGNNATLELHIPKKTQEELESKNKLKNWNGGATRIRTGG